MGRKPAYCYTKIDRRCYQKKRSKRGREFVRGCPDDKITIYDIGNVKGKFSVALALVSVETGRISHVALEAARITANRRLQKNLSREKYHFKVRMHPNDVLREHKMMAFAGADRLQSGMSHSFGKPIGRAVRLEKAGKIIMHARVEATNTATTAAKEALLLASRKFPLRTEVVTEFVADDAYMYKYNLPRKHKYIRNKQKFRKYSGQASSWLQHQEVLSAKAAASSDAEEMESDEAFHEEE